MAEFNYFCPECEWTGFQSDLMSHPADPLNYSYCPRCKAENPTSLDNDEIRAMSDAFGIEEQSEIFESPPISQSEPAYSLYESLRAKGLVDRRPARGGAGFIYSATTKAKNLFI